MWDYKGEAVIYVLLSFALTGCNLPGTVPPGIEGETVVYPGTLLATATEPNGAEQVEIEERIDVVVLKQEENDDYTEVGRGVTGSRLGGLPTGTLRVQLGTGDEALQTEDGCWFFEVDGIYRVHEPTFVDIRDDAGATVKIATHMFTGENYFACTVTAHDTLPDVIPSTVESADELRGPNQIYAFPLAEQWIRLSSCRDVIPDDSPTFGGVLQDDETLGLSGNGLTIYGGDGMIPIIESVIQVDGDFSYAYYDGPSDQLIDVACATTM